MYCKFCGNEISSDMTKCTLCGANIDINDGGQSFFENDELSVWRTGNMSNSSRTSMPKTEMRGALPSQKDDSEKEYNFEASQENMRKKGVYSRARTKKKKKVSDYLNVSSSDKLIIFCIASALAIVLLAVAIIAVLKSGDENVDETVSQNETSAYTQQFDEASENGNDNQQNAEVSRDGETTEKETEEDDVLKDKTEIKDVKIFDKDGKEVSHSVSAYTDKTEILYVSLDKILKHEGYKSGIANGNDKKRVVYEHKSNGKVIEIEKGTNKIWITEAGEKAVTQWLEAINFNVGNDTYVPIKSFLTKYGYDGSKITWDEKDKILYFCK